MLSPEHDDEVPSYVAAFASTLSKKVKEGQAEFKNCFWMGGIDAFHDCKILCVLGFNKRVRMKTLAQVLFAGVCSLGLAGSAFSVQRDIPQQEAQFLTNAVCEALVEGYEPSRDGLQFAQSEGSVQAEILGLFRQGASFTREVAYAFDVSRLQDVRLLPG